MTKKLGYQVEVFNKEQALMTQTMRSNAYPLFTEYHGINRTLISFLMVDLDLKDSEPKKGKVVLDKALNKT